MRQASIIFLIIAVITLAYFLGRNHGASNIKTSVLNQVELINEIAELSTLEARGITQIKVSNAPVNGGYWDKFKNYFTENTLQVQIPYQAKYGVNLDSNVVKISVKKNTVLLEFPAVKLLSFQLQMDKIETMNQTGLFAQTTIGDLRNAQKKMYQSAVQNLTNAENLKQKAKEKIIKIFEQYFKPFGFEVECNFKK